MQKVMSAFFWTDKKVRKNRVISKLLNAELQLLPRHQQTSIRADSKTNLWRNGETSDALIGRP